MMHAYRTVLAIACLAAMASCQTAKINPTAGGGGLTGRWAPDGGGYTAIFNNGQFSTTAADTGNIISQGSYQAVSEKEVTLSWSSNITGLQNSARCERPEPEIMNCTDAGGKSFILRKSTT